MRRIDGVLFDWGDTLFRSPDAPRVIVEAASERGVTVASAAAAALWDHLWRAGKTPEEHAKGRDLSPDAHRQVWTALFASANDIAPGLAEALYERVMEPSRWTPYNDAAPTLRALHERGVRTGVVSNIARDLRAIFARHGLAGAVDVYALSYERGVTKPEPQLFRWACAELGIAPESTLMVGDDPVTDGGAAAAGLQVYVLPHDGAGESRGLHNVLEIVDRSRQTSP